MPIIDVLGAVPTPETYRSWVPNQASSPSYLKMFANGIQRMAGIGQEEYDHLWQTLPWEKLVATLTEKAVQHSSRDLDSFVAELDSENVARMVLHSEDTETVTGAPRLSHEHIAEVVKTYPHKFIGFAGVDPYKGRIAERELDKAFGVMGFRGAFVLPLRIHRPPTDPLYDFIWHKCVEYDVPVWVHGAHHWNTTLPMDLNHPNRLNEVATRFPDLKLIVGHIGWPWVLDAVCLAWRHPNVYLDTSAFRPKYMAGVGSGFEPLLNYGNGPIRHKVLFGSTWYLLGMSVGAIAGEIAELPLKPETVQAWLYENAARLLAIE